MHRFFFLTGTLGKRKVNLCTKPADIAKRDVHLLVCVCLLRFAPVFHKMHGCTATNGRYATRFSSQTCGRQINKFVSTVVPVLDGRKEGRMQLTYSQSSSKGNQKALCSAISYTTKPSLSEADATPAVPALRTYNRNVLGLLSHARVRTARSNGRVFCDDAEL